MANQDDLKEYTAFIEKHPTSHVGYCNRGMTYLSMQKYEEALNDLNQAIKYDQSLPEIFHNRGVANSMLKHNPQAISDYTEAIKLKQDFAEPYLMRGQEYQQIGKIKEAIEDFTKAIERKPDIYEAYCSRANLYFTEGKTNEAIADYTKAINLNPKLENAYNNRGVIYSKLKRCEEAIADFTKVIELQPDSKGIFTMRASQYQALGKNAEALKDLTEAITKNPKDVAALNNRGKSSGYWLGVILHALGRNQEAIDDYSKAILLDSNDPAAYQNRGVCYSFLKKRELAIADFTKAIALKPDNDAAYAMRANELRALDKKQEAIADYTQAIKLNPHSEGAYNNRGVVYSDLGQQKEALADYSQAIALNPKSDAAYNNRGVIYAQMKEKEKAIADYLQAIKLNPKNPIQLSNLGSIYQVNNQQSEANIYFAKALKIIESLNETDITDLQISKKQIESMKQKISLIKTLQQKLNQARSLIKLKTLKPEQNQEIDNIITHFEEQAAPEIIKAPQENQDNSRFEKMIEELSKRLDKVEKQNEQLKDRLETVESLDKIKIEKEMRLLDQDQKKWRYFRSFYWRIRNFLHACQQLQTNLFQSNTDAVVDTKLEQITDYIGKGVNLGSSVAGSIPVIGSVFETVGKCLDAGFGYYKERKFAKRVERLATVVMAKTIDIDIELQFAGVDLAKQLPENPQDIQESQQEQYSNYRDQISSAEEKYGLQDAKDPFYQLGIDHSLIALLYLEGKCEEILNNNEQKLRDIIVQAVKEQIQTQKTQQQETVIAPQPVPDNCCQISCVIQ